LGAMAYDVFQRPGAWVSGRVARRRAWLLSFLFVYAVLTLAVMWLAITRRLSVLASLAVMAVALALRPLADRLIDRHFRLKRGADAEAEVGALLNQLRREGWIVMHDLVQAREGNIDHLVSGPGGVFLIETKFRRYEERQLVKAKRQAAKLYEPLGVSITPIIALHTRRNPRWFKTKGVWIVPRQSLLDFLRGQRNAVADFERLARFAESQ
jgi:hypothetical protein